MFASVNFYLLISIVIRRLLVTLLILAQLACTWQYTAHRFNHGLSTLGLKADYSVSREHIWVLPSQAKVIIGPPLIDSSLEHKHPKFREYLMAALGQAADVRFSSALPIEQWSNEELLQEQALEYGADYILQPFVDVILDVSSKQVRHNVRALKATRDEITLGLKVMDVQNYALLDTVIVKANSVFSRKNVDSAETLLEPALTALFTQI